MPNIFQWIMTVFGLPLGYIMWAMYQIVHNYGVAIILFTIVTKLLLIPLAIKQQKSTIKLQIIQPKMQEIQAKYKNNPQKMNEEIQALYERENYSMTAGCLPMLIQFPIIFGLLDVVYRPLTHLLHISSTAMEQAKQIAVGIIGTNATSGYAPEIAVFNSIKADPAAYAALGTDVLDKILAFDMHFLGLDLSTFPNQVITLGLSGEALKSMLNPIILIPILSGATALIMSLVTMRNAAGPSNSSMGAMMLMMPLMSVYIAFIMPAALGVYWIAQSAFSIIQEAVLGKFYTKRIQAEEDARFEAREADRKRRQEEAKVLQEKQKQQAAQKKSLKEKRQEAQEAKNKAKKPSTTEAGRVGERPYARGRSYKADRYDTED